MTKHEVTSVLPKEVDNILTKHEDGNTSAKKEDSNVLTTHEDGNVSVKDVTVLSNDSDEDSTVLGEDEDDNILAKEEDVTVSTDDEDSNALSKHEGSSTLTKEEDSNLLSKHEGSSTLTKEEDSDVLTNETFSITQMFDYQAFWTTIADKCTHWKESIQQTMTKDDNVLSFSITDYQAYRTTIADKCTHWKESIRQTMTKDDNVLSFSITQMFDYQAHWATIADKCTHWKESVQQTVMKDDNVLKKSWKASSTRWNKSKNFRWSVSATLLLLIISIFIPIFNRSQSIGDVNYVCQFPQVIQPWQIKAFRPKWFGLVGGPAPITYKTKGSKGHQVFIVDIDRRDIEIGIWVDGKSLSHKPVVLDNTVSCGEDLANCINQGFGGAIISVPPGKHIIRAEILDVNGTFRWEHERQRRVWWKLEECS